MKRNTKRRQPGRNRFNGAALVGVRNVQGAVCWAEQSPMRFNGAALVGVRNAARKSEASTAAASFNGAALVGVRNAFASFASV